MKTNNEVLIPKHLGIYSAHMRPELGSLLKLASQAHGHPVGTSTPVHPGSQWQHMQPGHREAPASVVHESTFLLPCPSSCCFLLPIFTCQSQPTRMPLLLETCPEGCTFCKLVAFCVQYVLPWFICRVSERAEVLHISHTEEGPNAPRARRTN